MGKLIKFPEDRWHQRDAFDVPNADLLGALLGQGVDLNQFTAQQRVYEQQVNAIFRQLIPPKGPLS